MLVIQYFTQSEVKLTLDAELYKQNDADLQREDIENEMAEVVSSNAVMDPGAMAR